MLHDEIRNTRERLGISQASLARSADVPRSQLAIFESGGNITLSTLAKILDRLPLRLELLPETTRLEEARRAAQELQEIAAAMHAAAGRLLDALGGRAQPEKSAPPPESRGPGGAGATRFEAGVSPELDRRLRELLAEAEKNKPPK